MDLRRRTAFVLGCYAACCCPASAASFGPSSYFSFADSPFAQGVYDYFFLEDFEDGSLNTPGASVNEGISIISPGVLTDSVDGDDGAVDGSGLLGHSLYSGSSPGLTQIVFSFASLPISGLPTHAGVVWTDVGNVTSGDSFEGFATAEAFDSAGVSIGTIGPAMVGGDASAMGQTSEDRFFGFSHTTGISRLEIRVSNSIDWEVDHLQYGRIVPEPDCFVLFLALLLLPRRKNFSEVQIPFA